jgi:ABC-type transport system substrate-binding protein
MHRRFWLLVVGGALAATLAAAGAMAAHVQRGTASTTALKAAPFNWAAVPKTTAARKAKSVLVFGEEQDINGFNTTLNCCNALAAGYIGELETQHGAFNLNQKGQWFKDLVSDASANSKTLSYTIRPDANWYWGGKKVPVTYKDFVYTWQQYIKPSNDVVTRTPYNQIARFTHKGDKQITFYWKACGSAGNTPEHPCGPYANWQSAFSGLFPAAALAGQDFNKIWTNCICGKDGKPVSNGPFYLASYTKGQGTTLKKNPFYYKPAKLAELDFKIIADTNTEVQAMRGGEVDAIAPTFGQNLLPLKSTPGLVYNAMPGYFQEHIDIQEGPKSQNPILRAPWVRQAIMMGIDRKAVIQGAYGSLAAGTAPLNSLLYYSTQDGYKGPFAKWDYNPTAAIALLKKNGCTGGPSAPSSGNSAIWTCAGRPAEFRYSWTSSNATRTNQEAIVEAQLKQIGIKVNAAPRAANVFFGQYVSTGDYDLANFAWVTTGDPGDYYDIWRCGGESNYHHYCSNKASGLMSKGQSELDPAARTTEFQQADAIMAAGIPSIPLYQRPVPLIYKSAIGGMINNPSLAGPMWNCVVWFCKS